MLGVEHAVSGEMKYSGMLDRLYRRPRRPLVPPNIGVLPESIVDDVCFSSSLRESFELHGGRRPHHGLFLVTTMVVVGIGDDHGACRLRAQSRGDVKKLSSGGHHLQRTAFHEESTIGPEKRSKGDNAEDAVGAQDDSIDVNDRRLERRPQEVVQIRHRLKLWLVIDAVGRMKRLELRDDLIF